MNEYSMDMDLIKEAAERWKEHEPERIRKKELLKEGKYTEVDTLDRLAKHTNRLLDNVRKVRPHMEEGMPEELAELADHVPYNSKDINDQVFERVIGLTRDFLNVGFLEKGAFVTQSVGRIITDLGNGRVSYGTGFLVSPNLLLTNWHVLKTASIASESFIEFNYQLDLLDNPLPVERFDLEPKRFYLSDRVLDFALVAVKPTSKKGTRLSNFNFCKLIKAQGKITHGRCVNIIQHPLGEMKQVVIRENELSNILDLHLHYKGDTEPGSSGSPVFSDLWEVVALHHSGVPRTDEQGRMLNVSGGLWRNGDDPKSLAWVANEGVRISKILHFVEGAEAKDHEEPLRVELLSFSENAVDLTKTTGETDKHKVNEEEKEVPSHQREHPSQNQFNLDAQDLKLNQGSVSFTIPITITLSLGDAKVQQALSPNTTGGGGSSKEDASEEDALEKISPDKNYEARPGFVENFPDFPAPLPRLTRRLVQHAALVNGSINSQKKFELKYYNYSVVMNKSRKMAFVSAVNFFANAPAKAGRQGKDSWFKDPRLSAEFQTDNAVYKSNPYDRGHLTRRADAAWGNTESEAKLANDDTFHFTNCAPQHEVYNQSTKADSRGVVLWGNIENHIAEQSKKNKLKISIFNGPILKKDDPFLKGSDGIFLPREFYKVLAFKKDNGDPTCIAFILSQDSLIKEVQEEEFVVGRYKPYQVKVAHVENLTGLSFGKLKSLDPLDAGEGEENFLEGLEIVEINREADIIF
ncbi:DNA/RNA non-specific endonuclease [soil metagenome]